VIFLIYILYFNCYKKIEIWLVYRINNHLRT